MLAYPLERLATIYRERGDLALARGAYEEAIALAEQAGDLQILVPALAGLARVLADEEPEEAARLAARAVEYGPGMAHVGGLLAAGRVALARREPEPAAAAGLEAAAAARARRDRPGLAEALELQALAGSPERAAARLEEALAVWRELGDPLGEAGAELELARVTGELELAGRAERRLRELGARGRAAAASALCAELERRARPPVAFRTLGAFRTLRDGEPVALAEWQSRKARDLLKILIARRGRPVPRDFLMEALWPGEDPQRLANRLSVALATVRSVLDPEKHHGAERFVAADSGAVRLELANVDVDVEAFLADAAAAFGLLRDARTDEAHELLVRAEAAYAGDFLEEDAYEDWAVPLREEAQALYVQVARALAGAASARGEHDAATRYLLRTLERDPYDEQAHLGLVATLLASGRHGAARRFYRSYCARMDEIGVEAAPYPSPRR
jgi:DNA-binding SARP family transcriptional activator